MDAQHEYQPGPALRWLHRLLDWSRLPLVPVTVFFAAWVVLFVWTGSGSTAVLATIDEPIEITLQDGRYLGVDQTGHVETYGNYPDDLDDGIRLSRTAVAAWIDIPRDNTASRAISGARLALWLAAVWVGLTSLRAIVAGAVAGEPFDARNPARLRYLGGAILSVPIAGKVAQLLLDYTLRADIEVAVSFTESWLVPLLAGLACFGLAEVFAEAARLREFEEATI